MRPALPNDANGRPVQALKPNVATISAPITIGAASASVALPSGAQIVRVSASGDCWLKFGTSGVTATASDIFFPKGAELFALDPAWTHIAAIQDGASTGKVSVVEMY